MLLSSLTTMSTIFFIGIVAAKLAALEVWSSASGNIKAVAEAQFGP